MKGNQSNLAARWEVGERNIILTAEFHALNGDELAEGLEALAHMIRSGQPMPHDWRADNCPFRWEITKHYDVPSTIIDTIDDEGPKK